jgi:hypothetical protein
MLVERVGVAVHQHLPGAQRDEGSLIVSFAPNHNVAGA